MRKVARDISIGDCENHARYIESVRPPFACDHPLQKKRFKQISNGKYDYLVKSKETQMKLWKVLQLKPELHYSCHSSHPYRLTTLVSLVFLFKLKYLVSSVTFVTHMFCFIFVYNLLLTYFLASTSFNIEIFKHREKLCKLET